MDLVRGLLLFVEENTNNRQPIFEPDLEDEGYDDNVVDYHIGLIYERRLIRAERVGGGAQWLIRGLTWEGHEFLDEARSDTVWERAREKAGGTFQTVSLEVLKALLQTTARELLGIQQT